MGILAESGGQGKPRQWSVAFVGRLWNAAEVQSEAPALPSEPARAAPGSRDPWARWLFAAALLVGLLRFWKLGEWSLWYDEAATWFDLHGSLDGEEIHNPLGYRLIGWVVDLCGGVPSEWSLRLLPAIAGWLVVPLTWLVFRKPVGARRAAAAALLVACSSWHIHWSQTARFYTLAQLFALAGGGLALRGLFGGSVLATIAGAALTACAGLFHASGVLLVPALALAPWLLAPLRLPELARARRPALALLVLSRLGALGGWSWVRAAWETYLRHAPTPSSGHLLTTGFYVTPIVATAGALGLWQAWRRRRAFDLVVAALVAAVLLAVLVASLRVQVSAQYVFVLWPWMALLATAPLEAAPAPLERRRDLLELGWIALLALPLCVNSALYFGVRQGERPQWRAAYEYVWNQRESDDLVLGMEACVGEFYLDPRKLDLRNAERIGWLDRWHSELPAEWGAHARRTWYVFNAEQLKGWEDDARERFERFLHERCRLAKVFPLWVESRDLSVWVYVRG